MKRSMREVFDQADELAQRFEDYEPEVVDRIRESLQRGMADASAGRLVRRDDFLSDDE